MPWNANNIARYYGDRWSSMSPDLQTLAQQYALADQNINGGALPSFDSFTPAQSTQANYAGALPKGLDRVVAGAGGGFGVGSGKFHPEGYEIVADPRGAEDFSIARAVAYQNDPSRYDSRWGGAAWTGDDTWLTSPGGATFARSDLLNPNLTDADIIARNKQYASGALTPMAAVKGATGEGTPLYYFNDPASLQQKSAEDAAAAKQAAAIRGAVPGEVSANADVIGRAAQDEAIGRIKASLPDVSGLKPNMNLDGSINYDWMVQWATGKATKPAWADQYEQAWNSAVQDFTTQAQQPQQIAQALMAPQSAQVSAPSGGQMASALRSFGQPAAQSSSDPFSAARQDWATWGAGQGGYAKPAWWGGVKGGEFAPIALEEPAAGSPEAMSQEAPFNPVLQPSTATTAPGFSTSMAMGLGNANGMYQPTYGANAGNMPSVSTSDNSSVPNYTDIGGIVGGLVPFPGSSAVGRGIGAAFDIGGANSQLEKHGLKGDLGVIDWGKAVWPEWAGGTPAASSMANSVFDQGFAGSYTPQGLQSVSPLGTQPGSQGQLLQTITSPLLMSGFDFSPSSLGGSNFGFGAGGMF